MPKRNILKWIIGSVLVVGTMAAILGYSYKQNISKKNDQAIVAPSPSATTSINYMTPQPVSPYVPNISLRSSPSPKTLGYVEVTTLSGTGSKRSDTFHLEGNKLKLTYTVNGQYSPYVHVKVNEAGSTYSGMYEPFTIDQSGTDSAYLIPHYPVVSATGTL